MINVVWEEVRHITDEQLLDKVKELIDEFDAIDYNTPTQVEKLFYFHNRIYPQSREDGKGCPPCRAKVRNRLGQWINEKQNND